MTTVFLNSAASITSYSDLALVDGDYVYWTTDAGAILRTPKDGSGAAPEVVVDAQGAIATVVTTSDALVYVRPSGGVIARALKNGSQRGAPVVLAQNETGVVAAAVAGANVYWGAGNAVRSVPLAGGTPTTFAASSRSRTSSP